MSVSPSPSEHPPQIDLILGPPGGGELKPKDFSAVDPVSRENIYEEELGKHTHLNVQLHLAQFGVYDGEPAALLVFRFIFQYRSGRKRITAVSINAQFRTEGPEAIPYVVSLAPEQVNGEIFEEQCTHAVSGGVHLGAPYLGAGFQANTGGTFTRQHVLSLQGSRKSSDLKGAVYDRVVWDCEETRKKAKGIIPKYLGAVIVKCSGRFSATFDVDVTQASWLSNLQYKYETLIGRGESCPIVFDRARPFGDPVTDITDFKELDLDKLISEEPARLVLRAPPNNQEMLETPVQTGISPGNAQADTSTGEASDFPTTAYYNQVNALLLYWEEDDLGCKKEIDKVRETFENRFYYRTQTFVIPSQRSQANLQKALSDFVMETACSSGLTVIYYAGHGAPDNGSDERLSKLIWAAKGEGDPTLTWTDVQPTLLSAEGDVLLLLDCCHASLAVRSLHGATVEVLAACALNVRALGVGKQSFTTALLSELRRVARSKTTITVEALFWWLTTDVARLVEMPFRWGTSRIHQRSIVLRPLSAPSGSPEPEASLSAN